jgi:hypothetical protein
MEETVEALLELAGKCPGRLTEETTAGLEALLDGQERVGYMSELEKAEEALAEWQRIEEEAGELYAMELKCLNAAQAALDAASDAKAKTAYIVRRLKGEK